MINLHVKYEDFVMINLHVKYEDFVIYGFQDDGLKPYGLQTDRLANISNININKIPPLLEVGGGGGS